MKGSQRMRKNLVSDKHSKTYAHCAFRAFADGAYKLLDTRNAPIKFFLNYNKVLKTVLLWKMTFVDFSKRLIVDL